MSDISIMFLDKCGFAVEKVCLVMIDNTYIRHGDLELDTYAMVKVWGKLREIMEKNHE